MTNNSNINYPINNHNIIINNHDMQNIFVNCKNNLMNYIDRELMREYLMVEMTYYLWSTSVVIHNNHNHNNYEIFLINQLNTFRNMHFELEIKNLLNSILDDFHLLNLEQKKLMFNYISSLFRDY